MKLQFTKTAILPILLIGAIGFTLTSCSGDDGSDGTTPMCTNGTWHNGSTDTGVSCSAGGSTPPTCVNGTWHNGGTDTGTPCTAGTTPTCVDGTWHNGTADTGVPCATEGCVTTDKGAYIEIACGKNTVEIAKAMCGATAYDPNKQLCDARDGKMYKLATIGTQVWMAENLNYVTSTSKCSDTPADCNKYGRLYNYATALTVCPTGLHLPDTTELNVLIEVAGGKATAGKKLKATADWKDYIAGTDAVIGKGTDDYNFTALPSGYALGQDQNISNVGSYYSMWTATENSATVAYYLEISNEDDGAGLYNNNKMFMLSVRCIKD